MEVTNNYTVITRTGILTDSVWAGVMSNTCIICHLLIAKKCTRQHMRLLVLKYSIVQESPTKKNK